METSLKIRRMYMKKHLVQLLSWLLTIAMLVGMLPTLAFAANDEAIATDADLTATDYAAADALFAQIDAMEDAAAKRNDSQTAKANAAYEIVVNSDNYVEGSIDRKGNAFTWMTTEGIRCAYNPAHRERTANMTAPEAAEPDGAYNVPKAVKGGSPAGNQVYLIGPYYGHDSDFTNQYKNTASAVATAIGDSDGYTLYSGTAATIETVAAALSAGAVVFFDSHGTTDYASGDDYVTGATSSYLCLKSTTGVTSADYTAGKAVYLSDGVGVNGSLIAEHMTSDNPNGLLWMAICLGMATDGMYAPLREKGVGVVYGYSQSVSFDGDYVWSEVFWEQMNNGATVAEAVAEMKSQYGQWDYSPEMYEVYSGSWYSSWVSDTISEARSTYCAFPIVVSDEDTHPGQKSSSSYGADSLQTVKSTYTLFSQYSISATTNNSAYGTVSVNGSTITASPAEGYFASGYTVTSGSATVTQNGNIFTVSASSDCTIQINFTAKTSVTVSFAGASGVADQTGYAGDAMTLPTVTAPDGYSFIGWTENALSNATTTKPTYYTDTYYPAGNTTLYALYSYVESSGETGSGDYVKVTNPPVDWSGEYLIVYEADSYIFNGSLTSLDATSNYKAVTITDNTISAEEGDPYKFTIAATENAYSIMGVGGKYIGQGSNANGLTSSDSALDNTIALDSEGNATIVSDGGAYLRYNATSGQYRFRYYKSSSYSSQKAIALYVKDGSAGTTYYTSSATACAHANTVNTEAVAATCTYSGYTAGVYCNDCNSYISGHSVVEATGHSYSAVITAPTATEQGYTTNTCTACGDSYISDYTDALGETYTISFVVPEGVEAIADMNCDKNGIELPTAGIPYDNYTFIGWADVQIDKTISAPSYYSGAYTATANTTLYALYTYEVGGSGSTEYVLTDIAGISSTDIVVVTSQYSDTVYALSSFNGSTDAPDAVVVNVADNKLTDEPAQDLLWNIVSENGSYKLYPQDNADIWLYCNSSNNGVRVGTGSSNTFTIDSDYLYNESTGRYLGVYRTNPDWRCYTSTSGNIASQTVGFYVKSAGGTTYYTTVIGESCQHENTDSTTVNATCTAGGSITVTCNDCGVIISTTEIEATGHNYQQTAAVDATCTEDGSLTYTCANCDDSYTETVAATGHSYVDGTCTACGDTEPTESDTTESETNEPEPTEPTEPEGGSTELEGRYYIAGIRTSDINYQYIMGVPDGTRYDIEDSGLTELPAEITSPEADKIFVIEKNSNGTYRIYAEGITDDAKYLGWTGSNSGTFVAVDDALSLTIDAVDGGLYNIHFSADYERYLSLNNTASLTYAAWYRSGQIKDLALIPVRGATIEHTHSVTYFEGSPATCTESGTIAYYYCSDEACPDYGKYYSDEALTIEILAVDLIDPAIGHSYSYTNNGDNHTATCANCSDSVTEDHTYVDGTCACGATEVVAPKPDANLVFTMNISAGAEMTVT
ncbi:MAG: hypothetical protein E7434_05415, partial [Ruminococcaceae bacterium]|nr:hypothetical protein [Oscillospiraceae bacterium]